MSNILMTMAEERESTRDDYFAVKYKVDEHDCFDFSNALMALGHDVFFVNWDDLHDRQFIRMFRYNHKEFVTPLSLESFDLIFVYKMEGYYFDLERFFRMVQTFEHTGRLVINHPATIRHNIDKRYLWDLEKKGIQVVPTHYVDDSVRRRLADGESFVVKPIRGERGNDVLLIRNVEELSTIAGRENEYLAQNFMADIRHGERSLVFLGFQYQHAVLKRPSADRPHEFRCNESVGGTVAVYQPTAEDLDFAERTLRAYESLGCPIHYSRIDLIQTAKGPTLMEAELINPSIFANYSGKGVEFGKSIARYFDQLLTKRQGAH